MKDMLHFSLSTNIWLQSLIQSYSVSITSHLNGGVTQVLCCFTVIIQSFLLAAASVADF